jgi:hypothetical protein
LNNLSELRRKCIISIIQIKKITAQTFQRRLQRVLYRPLLLENCGYLLHRQLGVLSYFLYGKSGSPQIYYNFGNAPLLALPLAYGNALPLAYGNTPLLALSLAYGNAPLLALSLAYGNALPFAYGNAFASSMVYAAGEV